MARTWTGALVAVPVAMVLLGIGWLADVTWMRIAFGLPLLVLLPGGLAVWALFPAISTEGIRGLRGLERLVLSVGLSVVLVPLLGLGLEMAGAFREAVFVAWLEGLCLVLLLVAVARSLRLPRADRWPPEWKGQVGASTVVLALLALGATGAVVGFMVNPADREGFTEMALFGATGSRTCYPAAYDGSQYTATALTTDNLTVPEPGCPRPADRVTLVVANHEGRSIDYRLLVWWASGDGRDPVAEQQVDDISFTLRDDGKALYNQTFTLPPPPGTGMQFLVFQVFTGAAPPIVAGQPLPTTEHSVRLAIAA